MGQVYRYNIATGYIDEQEPSSPLLRWLMAAQPDGRLPKGKIQVVRVAVDRGFARHVDQPCVFFERERRETRDPDVVTYFCMECFEITDGGRRELDRQRARFNLAVDLGVPCHPRLDKLIYGD